MSNWIASTVIVLFAGAALLAMNSTGKTSRQYQDAFHTGDQRIPIIVAESSPEVFAAWKDREMHGRIMVHMGKYLHFVPPDVSGLYARIERFPITTTSLSRVYERMVSHRNLLWIAMSTNIARQIYHVLPPNRFAEKRMAVGAYTKKISVKQDSIITHFLGSPRVISDGMPAIKEPVLLIIDASYLEYSNGSLLLNDIEASGLKTDLLILCLAKDNPDVQEKEREKMREFAQLLRKSGNENER